VRRPPLVPVVRLRSLAFWRRAKRERQAVPWHGRGRLLDFGCGGGAYLDRMNKLGWQVTGLDTSPVAVARIRRDRGLQALVGSLPHPQLERGSFDVITMWHSLEHVHEPLEVLKAAHALLSPGGKLLVAVPNIDSLAFRWFGMAWYALDLPRHLTHFSPQTLPLMLERAGFRPRPVQMVRHGNWMRSSAQRALQLANPAHPDPWHRWLTRKPVARLATWYSYWTNQTDCMLITADK
jgi:SAM-dependent methyltransferase